THPNGSSVLSEMDTSALKAIKLDLIAGVGVSNGVPQEASIAYLKRSDSKTQVSKMEHYSIDEFMIINAMDLIASIESDYKGEKEITVRVTEDEEKAVLVGINGIEDLDELEELLNTAGGIQISRLAQNRTNADSTFLIGRGKLKEVVAEVQKKEANLVVFDEELSGAQIRNLEREIGVRVIDRTQLILDIFAKRARSKEGKLQVELAQLKYLMPRLIGFGIQMSRTGGGIGTRGPGEKKLEIDRRKIRDRVRELENEVKDIKKNRDLRRVNRLGSVFHVCLVGYTNAGKSTLLNSLSDSEIYVEDQLFATLDPTVKRVCLNSGQEIVVTDTVGFIKKLPHDLVAAFKSTLEEATYADLLVHVVDVSNRNYEMQIDVVNGVMKDLRADDKPVLLAMNKVDKIDHDVQDLSYGADTIFISAKNKINLDLLLNRIEHYVNRNFQTIELNVPYSDGSIIAYLHNSGKILEKDYKDNGIHIKGEFDSIAIAKVKNYIV
ncbi:MAG: GTPase HflX, partial [Lutispora sp.]